MIEISLKERLRGLIRSSRHNVFVRKDFLLSGATSRQLSRALIQLQDEGEVLRVGYGLYVRPAIPFEQCIEQIHQRLGKRARRDVTIEGRTVQFGGPKNVRNKQVLLDRRKLAMARRISEQFPMPLIRQRSLANMERWQKNGVWVSAFEEWRKLLTHSTDEEVLAVMIGQDEKSNRLRQSAPYAGLLSQAEVESF